LLEYLCTLVNPPAAFAEPILTAKDQQQNAKATAAARFFYKYANHLVSAGGSQIRHG
jgi:hypothetical protein